MPPLLPFRAPNLRSASANASTSPAIRCKVVCPPQRQQQHVRPFTITPAALKLPKNLPPRRVIPDSEFTEKFLHGSGPGGQKINKTSSAVQLKHLPTGIVVKCQETRSRDQNRKLARKALQEAIEELELGEMSRTAVKAREASRKKKSNEKKRRRKYKALTAGEEGEGEGVQEGELVEGAFEGEEGRNEVEETGTAIEHAHVQKESGTSVEAESSKGKEVQGKRERKNGRRKGDKPLWQVG